MPGIPPLPTPDAQDSHAPDWDLGAVVSGLRRSREDTHNVRHQGRLRELPSRDVLEEVVKGLSAALFPTHLGRPDLQDDTIDDFVGSTLHHTLLLLAEQVRRALRFVTDPDASHDARLALRAREITGQFAARLPQVRALLVSDLNAAFQSDPAATSRSEILLCYPGMRAVISYRLAHELYQLGAPLLARIIADIAHASTGIDIHPGARIGAAFFIDHGTGVVIGETAVLGERVRLYQAVTLGAKRFPTDASGALLKGYPRHPMVEDDVVIYAGATVLGRITIGQGSTIGGNVWVTQDVPPGSNLTQAQLRNL